MFKRKNTEKPNLPKEYVWELEINGEDHTYSCIVTETMVTTYEDGVEKKHLKIMNPECKQGVLQIDTVTSLFGEPMSFQLERFIPYIRLEDGWTSSDTTKKDRLDATVATYRKNAKAEIITGIACVLITIIKYVVTGDMGDWYMLNVFGIFFIFAGLSTRLRLKRELEAMEKATEDAAEDKATAEEPTNEPAAKPEGIIAPKSEKE